MNMSSRFKVLETYYLNTEAELDYLTLRRHGIHAVISSSSAQPGGIGIYAIPAIKLFVRDEDLQRAIEALNKSTIVDEGSVQA